MNTMGWRLVTAFPPRMHVSVSCNIENENNGGLDAPWTGLFFPGEEVMQQVSNKEGGFVLGW